ncbi:MAG TPA: extracellular solute-binding protein [Xanthobacteraceae bacterium]|nr:extracellular solute-binding protein [Xanthobacteraceae bacterium]
MNPNLRLLPPAIVVAVAMLVGGCATADAEEMNPALKELAAAAGREGGITLGWGQSALGGTQGAARFQAAMNKAFGTNIRITFLPGPDMARVVNQVATEFSAGQRSHVDLVLGAAPQIAPVVKVDLFEPVDWTRYLPGRITAEMTELDGKVIRIATGLSGVTYNSQLAPMQPRVLDDFLRPEWKGKIASTPYAAGLDVLLADDVWGKQKTVSYVRALTKQIAGMTRCGETERIATGEYLALVMDCTGQDALLWQEKGAPVAQLMPLDAAQQRYYYFAVPKNAQHPNAAKLFAVFLLTPEGQALVYDTWKIDLHFMPGSKMGAMIADYQRRDVKFKEVTTQWWSEHPEIDASRSELIKILTTKE